MGNAGGMDFWPEFLASSWGKEFVAGGFGGTAGVISGYPLDSRMVPLSAYHVVATEGPLSLYRGMAAPSPSRSFFFLLSILLLHEFCYSIRIMIFI